MRILFITQFLPYPLDTGGKIKTYQTLRLLSKKHKVFLISFVDRKSDLKWEVKLRKYCFGFKTFITPIITTSHRYLKKKAFLSLFSFKPFRVQKYFLKETAVFINKLTKKENFDAIHFDHETSVQYLPHIYKCFKKLKVYDEHNICYEGFLSYVRYEKGIIKKLAYLTEALKFFFYERVIMTKFDQILTISQEDKKKILKWGVPFSKVKFFPVPFKIKNHFKFGSKNIIFISLLSWWPNKDAVLWFSKKIYPLIKKEIKDVKFLVIGKNADQEIKDTLDKEKSIKLIGHVKSLNKYLKKSGVLIVPVRSGAGVRIKILDALSWGMPIISTFAAAKGIKLKNKKEILLADDEGKFNKAVVDVLKNKKLALRLSENGLKFIKENYNFQKADEVLDRVYKC